MSLIRALESASISHNVQRKPSRFLVLLAFASILCVLPSCKSNKYLTDDQSFLFANKTKIKSKHRVPNKTELYDYMTTHYRQRETRTVFGIPRHEFYYQYQKRIERKPNSKKWSEERLIKNRPVIYDSTLAATTTEDFMRYLSYKGYRESIVTFNARTRDKETTVYYHVDPGPRLYIDTFRIIADDTAIQRIINEAPGPVIIKPGSPLDGELFNLEQSRLTRAVQNEGYATFDETYFPPLLADTSAGRVKIIMRVLNPTDSTRHLQYYVGNVTIYPDYDNTISRRYFDTIAYGVNYKLPDTPYFSLKPEVIDRNLYLRKGELTSIDNYDKTYKGLNRIDLIKFVTPSVYLDTSDLLFPNVNYTFSLNRNKKISFGANAELTYSNIAAGKKSLFGISFNADYRDLNTFRGAEVLNINLESGFEFNFKKPAAGQKRDIFNSVNLGLSTNLSFPRYMDPLRLYHIIGHRKDKEHKPLFGARLARWLEEDASTRVGVGYNFVDIQDLYQYYSINANLSYIMQPDPSRKLTLDRIGLDLFVPNPDSLFDEILLRNRFQRESFGKQLFAGFIFRSYLFEINNKSSTRSSYLRLFHSGEISGAEILAINLIENGLGNHVREFGIKTGQGDERDVVRFSHFMKGEIDLRLFYDFGRKSQVAFRINPGLAFPYGPFTKQVPYVKQFFVGGALSNRAWQIRELGPGSYEDPNTMNIDTSGLPFYQTGDIKFDLSLELRVPLFWYFQGALFMDAANVWTFKKDDERPGANFEWNRFYKELGVGYGYGVRLDFDLFILRVDVGYKLFSPYPVVNADGESSRYLRDFVRRFPSGGELQIAVGQKF